MSIVEAWFVQRLMGRNGRPRPRKKARPGWYYDPRKQARYRHWDGARWTGATSSTGDEPLPG